MIDWEPVKIAKIMSITNTREYDWARCSHKRKREWNWNSNLWPRRMYDYHWKCENESELGENFQICEDVVEEVMEKTKNNVWPMSRAGQNKPNCTTLSKTTLN